MRVQDGSHGGGPASTRALDGDDASPEEVEAALDRLLADPAFRVSDRNRRFLRYVVEETLAGRADRLKAYTIAIDVFGRDESFDAGGDPIVRIEASRLRHALGVYYSGAGLNHPVAIQIPKGGYVPFVEVRPAPSAGGAAALPSAGATPASEALERTPGRHWFRPRWIAWGSAALLAGVASAVAATLLRPPAATLEPVIRLAAVTPLGEDGETRQVAIGISQSLVTALSRFSGLSIVQTREPACGGDALAPADGPPVYGVGSTLRRVDGSMRFWWCLSDQRTGEVVWSNTHDWPLAGGFTIPVEDEVAAEVATRVAEPMGLIASREVRREDSRPSAGYGCVLRAQAYYLEASEALHREVRACLEATVAASPDYADAWTMLAYVNLDEDRNDYNRRGTAAQASDRALEAAQRAATIDPSSDTAQEALMIVLHRRGDFEGSEAAGARALALNPNNPQILSSVGVRLFIRGRWDEGAAMVRQAAALSVLVPPLDRITLAFDHYRQGDYEAALDEALLVNVPGFYGTHVLQAAVFGMLGRQGEARLAVDRLLALRPIYGQEMRADFRARHYTEPLIDMLAQGLRRAGLEVAD